MSRTLAPAFDEWCIVELLGHRRIAGRVREATFPAGFLRIDEPDGRTQIVNPASLYALHPTTEEIVRSLANDWRSEPVTRWEIERAERKADEMVTEYHDEGPF